MTPAATPILHLLDFSAYQSPPYDFAAMRAAGISGVIIKLTEGTDYRNPDFDLAWTGAKGMWRAVYHYCRPDLGDPAAEVAWLRRNLPADFGTYDGIAADLEAGSGNLAPYARSVLGGLEADMGFRPLCYSYPDFIRASLQDPALARYPLWLASLGTLPANAPPWGTIALWQYRWDAHIPGMNGPVDEDELARDLAGLQALGKPPGRGVIRRACSLKGEPNHTCAAIAALLAGTLVRTIVPTISSDDTWQRVLVGDRAGYVPASLVAAA